MPDAREGVVAEGDLEDPLGEVAHEVAPHSRAPLSGPRASLGDRSMLRVLPVLHAVSDGRRRRGRPVARERSRRRSRILRANPEVRDVIVSGGDPLTMITERIVRLLAAIRAVPSVETIRLATRVPVTLPMRVTRELVRALRPFHPLWLMTHFNHPKEVTRAAQVACIRFADAGFPVMNQTVLLAGSQRREGHSRGALPRPRPLSRAPLLPAPGRPRARHEPFADAPSPRGGAHGRAPGAAHRHRPAEAHLRHARRPRQRCRSPPTTSSTRSPGRTVLRTFRGEHVEYVDPPVRR